MVRKIGGILLIAPLLLGVGYFLFHLIGFIVMAGLFCIGMYFLFGR